MNKLGIIFSSVVALLISDVARAEEKTEGWTIGFTPVLLPKENGRFGGGADPELQYTVDLGGARLSAGGRVGVYYAKSLFGVTAMPTLRLTVPVGPLEPYASFGMGWGWLPTEHHDDVATMSRLGIVYRINKGLAIGLEGTIQKIEDSRFRFPSFGSAISFDL
jgi:hypothetical protein